MKVVFKELRGNVYPQSLGGGVSFSEGAKSRLTLAAKKIPTVADIDSGILEDIQSQIDDLNASISEVQSEQFRVELEKIVTIANDAIRHYAIPGPDGLADAVYDIVGRMYKIYQNELAESVSPPEAWGKAKSVLAKMDRAASIALKVKALGEVGKKVLEYIFS